MTFNHPLFSATHCNSEILYKLQGILLELALKPQRNPVAVTTSYYKEKALAFLYFCILQPFILLKGFTIYLP